MRKEGSSSEGVVSAVSRDPPGKLRPGSRGVDCKRQDFSRLEDSPVVCFDGVTGRSNIPFAIRLGLICWIVRAIRDERWLGSNRCEKAFFVAIRTCFALWFEEVMLNSNFAGFFTASSVALHFSG